MNGIIHRDDRGEGWFVSNPIQCPHCQHPITITDPRPGRFRIQCPSCASSFSLTVPDEPGAVPIVAMLEPAVARPTLPATETAPIEEITIEETRTSPPIDLDPPFQTPRWLGGYRVGRLVVPTRAGAAFEGRDWKAGRDVALTVIKPRWTADAAFVARFAREAFASAQLRHPNLAAPIDFNVDQGFPFAASDGLTGLPLSDPRGRSGLDRTARVAAVLHALRAIRVAHEQGIYHRDISLSKIRVDEMGLVLLADPGVGLTPDTPEIGAIIAPIPLAGSPLAPMPAPPSTAFARDDLLAMGRCLQTLVGGSQGDRAVPPGLAAVARRMAGEDPDGVYPDVGAAIRALESELGIGGLFTAREEEAVALEETARTFESPPLVRVRSQITLGVAAIIGLFVVLALLTGKRFTALGVLYFGAVVAAALVIVRGIIDRDPVFDRARRMVLGFDRGDILTALAGAALIVAVLVSTGQFWTWVFLKGLAVGLAVAYVFAIDRPLAQARAEAIDRARVLVRGLRRLGVDEDSVRRFVCRQAGSRWEEFFEAIFGYDALRMARARWGPDAGGQRRPRYATWRDPIIDAIDARIDTHRRARDRDLFQKIEERALEARGINLLTARRKAHRIAEAVVQYAHEFRHQTGEPAAGLPLMDAMNRVALKPDDYLTTTYSDDRAEPPVWRGALDLATRILFGPRTRFLAGGVLLAGSLLWMHQNALVPTEQITQTGLNATSDRKQAVADVGKIGRKIAANVQDVANAATDTKALEIGWLPPGVARRLDGFGLGVAGLILILSSFFSESASLFSPFPEPSSRPSVHA